MSFTKLLLHYRQTTGGLFYALLCFGFVKDKRLPLEQGTPAATAVST